MTTGAGTSTRARTFQVCTSSVTVPRRHALFALVGAADSVGSVAAGPNPRLQEKRHWWREENSRDHCFSFALSPYLQRWFCPCFLRLHCRPDEGDVDSAEGRTTT